MAGSGRAGAVATQRTEDIPATRYSAALSPASRFAPDQMITHTTPNRAALTCGASSDTIEGTQTGPPAQVQPPPTTHSGRRTSLPAQPRPGDAELANPMAR